METEYRERYYGKDKFPDNTDLLVRENLIPNAGKEAAHARNYFSAVTSVDHRDVVPDELELPPCLQRAVPTAAL